MLDPQSFSKLWTILLVYIEVKESVISNEIDKH